MITVKYGMSQTTTNATTLSDLQSDENIRSVLGFGESVRYLRNGMELSSVSTLESGDTIIVEPMANSKA